MHEISHSNDRSDRAQSCILAGVIGDAMGGPFEGQLGPLQYLEHKNWTLSDDSQLTLATCESIAEIGRVLPKSGDELFDRH